MSGGEKRQLDEDPPSPPSSPASSKRARLSTSASSSPPGSPSSLTSLASHSSFSTSIASFFPKNDEQAVEEAFAYADYEIDLGMKDLIEIAILADDEQAPNQQEDEDAEDAASRSISFQLDDESQVDEQLDESHAEDDVLTVDVDARQEMKKAVPSTNQSVIYETAYWVDLLVREMKEASDVETCRSEVLNILKDLEESIQAVLPKEGAAHSLSKRNFILREKNEDYKKKRKSLVNGVICLKERNDVLTQELEQLRLTISQYEERLEKRDENATLIRKDDGIYVTLPVNPLFHPDGEAGAVTSPHSPSFNMQDELDSIINRLSAIHLGTAAGDVENAFSFGASVATYQPLPLGILHWANLLVKEMNNDVEACKIGVGKIIEELERLLATVLPHDEAVDILKKECYSLLKEREMLAYDIGKLRGGYIALFEQRKELSDQILQSRKLISQCEI